MPIDNIWPNFFSPIWPLPDTSASLPRPRIRYPPPRCDSGPPTSPAWGELITAATRAPSEHSAPSSSIHDTPAFNMQAVSDLQSDLNSLLGHRSQPVPLSYGTAGFRGKAETLHEAVLRCGMLAACRSHALAGRAIGVMVTASHNPASDNGLKLIEPDGSMLHSDWETAATEFVNATDNPPAALAKMVNLDDVARQRKAVVVIGWDTRKSSAVLVDLVRQGVEVMGGSVKELGLVTTPQLHFSLRASDRKEAATLEDYYTSLRRAFGKLVREKRAMLPPLAVDCANGVGAVAVDAIRSALPAVAVVNRAHEGPLNQNCGADFVQKQRKMPEIYSKAVPKCKMWASLDGDADRLVMFEKRDGGIALADGDRFAALVTQFISKHMKQAGVSELSVAVAQTAYSNGAATEFLSNLPGVEVVIAKTGVKHLEKAVKKFDIGVYWEPNGHGTVLFSDKAVRELTSAKAKLVGEHDGSQQKRSLSTLLAVSLLANQAVGDGVADLLLILAILSREDMTTSEWLRLYDERYSSNLVVRVTDKSVIVTEDCDRLVKEPPALRDAIVKASEGEGCRAFVRPSGTEDVVRVYAEAPVKCEGKASEMAVEIARAVYDLCGGVGDRL